MKRGIHTIRSGITDEVNPSSSRRYSLDNGDFALNLQLTQFEVFPIANSRVGGNMDELSGETVFVTVATTPDGSIPNSGTDQPEFYGDVLNLRPSDSAQIAWGILAPARGYVWTLIDPDHIIPSDVWISAWSISSAGTINPVAYDIGFMMRFEQKKNSGAEALLYQVKQSDGIN